MIKLFFIIFINTFVLHASNALVYENSPYLQQHKDNPIHWYPWKRSTLELAQKMQKPIFLSIGYSTCHWCHVMAKESFENEEIAKLFNNNYLCIKVDREEMPHIDKYYQEVYKSRYKRSAGWPLSVFLTPSLEVYFIAGYMPNVKKYGAEGLRTLLPKLANKQTGIFKKSLQQTYNSVALNDQNFTSKTFQSLQEQYDDFEYGFSLAPKFPEASKLSLLFTLHALHIEGSQKMLFSILDAMAYRGLYDHVEGGFFRYSTDSSWEIPHFEKMLYTNAELISRYTQAYLLHQEPYYKSIINTSVAMLQKRFLKQGLFYSASDADTNHLEGDYFTFTPHELTQALKRLNTTQQREIVQNLQLYKTNFEGKYHLNIYSNSLPSSFSLFIKELELLRTHKSYPFIDTKINTAWNAMLIESLFISSLINKEHQVLAENTLEALLEKVYIKNVLYHQTLLHKKAIQKALLEDYAFLIAALLEGYQTNYKTSYLQLAQQLTQQALTLFYVNNKWYLNAEGIIKVEADSDDKYYQSALSKMLMNLLKLAALEGNRQYIHIVKKTLTSKEHLFMLHPANYPALTQVYLALQKGVVTLKSNKKELQQQRKLIKKTEYPFLVTQAKDNLQQYVACDANHCFSIEKELQKVLKSIEERK